MSGDEEAGVSPDRLWIVCPSYTDVVAFTMLRKRVLELVQSERLERSVQFVLVDDTGGNDDEVEDLRHLDDVLVVTPPFNLGHQRALVYGLRTIAPELGDADLVVTMDADGEDRPEDLPDLLAPLLDAPVARQMLCVARRTQRQESIRFKIMYFFFRVMFRILAGQTVRSGNYAAYRGGLARRMLRHPYFDLCYSSSLVSLDVAVTPVPCPRGERYAGQSRMNLFRLFMHGLRMLMPFTDRIAVRALAAFSVVFGLGVVGSLVVVAVRLFTTAAIPGWATTSLISIVILSFLALSNFIVLFVVFSHSRGLSMAGLEESEKEWERGARDPSSPRD